MCVAIRLLPLHTPRQMPSDKDVSMLLIALLANDDGVDIYNEYDKQQHERDEDKAGVGTKLFDYNAMHYGLIGVVMCVYMFL